MTKSLKNGYNVNLKATFFAVLQPKNKIFGHFLQPKNDIFWPKFQPIFAGLNHSQVRNHQDALTRVNARGALS